MKSFKDQLKEFRERIKLSRTDLAIKLDITPNYYIQAENGHKRIPFGFDICSRLIEIFGLSKKESIVFLQTAFNERASDDDRRFIARINYLGEQIYGIKTHYGMVDVDQFITKIKETHGPALEKVVQEKLNSPILKKIVSLLDGLTEDECMEVIASIEGLVKFKKSKRS